MCWTSRAMSGSSSTRSIRGSAESAMSGGGPRAKTHAGEFFPSRLAPPGIPQTAKPPVQGQLAVAEVFQHGVEQQDEDFTSAAEGQKVPLQPIGQSVAEPPGTHQHSKHVDQNAVSERGQQEGQQELVADEGLSQHPFHDEEKQYEQVS